MHPCVPPAAVLYACVGIKQWNNEQNGLDYMDLSINGARNPCMVSLFERRRTIGMVASAPGSWTSPWQSQLMILLYFGNLSSVYHIFPYNAHLSVMKHIYIYCIWDFNYKNIYVYLYISNNIVFIPLQSCSNNSYRTSVVGQFAFSAGHHWRRMQKPFWHSCAADVPTGHRHSNVGP